MSSKASEFFERPACLEPRKDVVIEGDHYVIVSEEPWLAFRSISGFNQAAFIELGYRAAICAAPVRPILRFWLGPERFQDHILPAPVHGVWRWIGRAPRGCTEVWISPTNRRGPIKFEVFEPRPAPFFALLQRMFRSPKRVFFALAAGWVKLQEEATLNWRWALGSLPLRCADAFSTPAANIPVRAARPDSHHFTILVDVSGASATQIDTTCASIRRQSLMNKRVRLIGAPIGVVALEKKAFWGEKPDFGWDASPDPGDGDVILSLLAGDALSEHALVCLSAYLSLNPEQKLVYADEIRQGSGGGEIPVFKPGWSPALQKSTRYVGRAAAFRANLLGDETDWAYLPADELVDRILSRLRLNEVGALRLPLFTSQAPLSLEIRPSDVLNAVSRPSVSIVIPTRDRADLLRACVNSLFANTTYADFEVVIVDNDSVEPPTLALLEELLSKHDCLKIIRVPGEFNFSALSNAGANASSGEYLLFLNNDTQIMTPDWIERLLFFATQSEIGAVGAKLLYPDRKVQHVGVLLGMGGVAGHFGAGLDEDDPGWMGRNLAPHEVSAVTGACLMVARSKFDAVGRFDEVNLPVDLNDVDLCLRLRERGWRAICHSQVVLIHHQSASRGGGLRLQQVYERERRFFVSRWRALIRDDPYFHPGLSLYSPTEMLP